MFLHFLGFFAEPVHEDTSGFVYLGIDREPYQSRCGLCGYVLRAGDRHGMTRLDGEIVCEIQMACVYPSKSAKLSSD